MKMKKTWIILFCVLVLTAGLSAQKEVKLRNCVRFDLDIQEAFKHYGRSGVNVELLSVVGSPIIEPGCCCEVKLWVAPVVRDPKARADTWHFCGGYIYKTYGPVPLGIRIISNRDRLIGCCKAADIVKKNFPKFPVEKATVKLYWVLYPSCTEPYYHFVYGDELHTIGAFTGKVYN